MSDDLPEEEMPIDIIPLDVFHRLITHDLMTGPPPAGRPVWIRSDGWLYLPVAIQNVNGALIIDFADLPTMADVTPTQEAPNE